MLIVLKLKVNNCRTFKLIQPNGETRIVTQLQTKKWEDLTAPSETKLLRDIVQRTRDLKNRDEREALSLFLGF